MNAPAKIGRPTIRRDDMLEEIIRDISLGFTLAEICRRPGMPERTVFYDWVNSDPILYQRFARARELGYDAISEECKEIADDSSRDYVLVDEDDAGGGRLAFNAEHVQRSKLRVDTRLKLLAKWSPRFADRVAVTGADGGAIQMETRQVMNLGQMSADERDKWRELIEAARAAGALDVTPEVDE